MIIENEFHELVAGVSGVQYMVGQRFAEYGDESRLWALERPSNLKEAVKRGYELNEKRCNNLKNEG